MLENQYFVNPNSIPQGFCRGWHLFPSAFHSLAAAGASSAGIAESTNGENHAWLSSPSAWRSTPQTSRTASSWHAQPKPSALSISRWSLTVNTGERKVKVASPGVGYVPSGHGRDEVWPMLAVPIALLSCRELGWVSDVVNQLSLSNTAGFGAGATPARQHGGSASPRCAPRAECLGETGGHRETPHLQHRLCVRDRVRSPFLPRCFPA